MMATLPVKSKRVAGVNVGGDGADIVSEYEGGGADGRRDSRQAFVSWRPQVQTSSSGGLGLLVFRSQNFDMRD